MEEWAMGTNTSDCALRSRSPRLRRRFEDPWARGTTKWASALFARLSPSALDELHRDALCCPPCGSSDDGWSLVAGDETPVTFLPLSVKFSDDVTIYVSYNGGEVSDDGVDGGVLELPACLIPQDVSEHSKIEVAALASVRDACILHVEPLTSGDWELLEAGANFLEGGALLQQVSVVYSGQMLPLCVGGKDAAWIRILPENFQRISSVWPESSSGTGAFCCLRLVRNTRVVVTPRPRRKREPCTILEMRVFPTSDDYAEAAIKLAVSLGKEQVSTTPGTVLVNPSTKIPELNAENTAVLAVVWNGPRLSMCDDLTLSCVLHLSFSDNVPEDHVALHPLTRSRLDVVALVDSVFLCALTPIEVARQSPTLNQQREGREVRVGTVELLTTRTAMKWRYPNNLNYHCGVDINALSHNGGEPSSKVSLLQHGAESDVYQASRDAPIESTNAGDAEFDGAPGKRSESGRWFQLPKDPPQSAGVSSFPFLHQNPTITNLETQDVIQLRSASHLLDLLPEFSHTPVELATTLSLVGDAVVYGAVGSGKSHTALVLAAVARFRRNTSTFYLDCKRLREGCRIRMKYILSEFRQLFEDTSCCRGDSVVILDDIDVLLLNHEDKTVGDGSAQSHQVNPVAVDQAKIVGDTLQRHLEVDAYQKLFSVIITCRGRMSPSPGVLNTRPFTRKVASPRLTSFERESILWKMIARAPEISDQSIVDAWKSYGMGRKMDGFGPRDLFLLASKVRKSLQSVQAKLTPDNAGVCTAKALETFVPLCQLSVSEGESAELDWSDIGGLFHVKEALTSTILNPAKYRRIYNLAKIRLPRGILVFGTPGCGKSCLVPALARKCGFALVTCRGPELLERYIGASESKVRELFARATASSPSILFFDDIDALAPRRGCDCTGVTDRVVNQLLTLLDGVEDSNSRGLVYVIAATSRPDIVDPALLRPGRLEEHVYVGSPASEDECTDLILKIASRYSVDEDLDEFISSGRFVRECIGTSFSFHGLSSADWKAAFDAAQLCAIHDLLKCDEGSQHISIGLHHLTAALRSTRPSLPERDKAMLMEIYRPFCKRFSAESCVGFAGSPGIPSLERGRELKTALR